MTHFSEKFEKDGPTEVRRKLVAGLYRTERARAAQRWLDAHSAESAAETKPIAHGSIKIRADENADKPANWSDKPLGKIALTVISGLLLAMALYIFRGHLGVPW